MYRWSSAMETMEAEAAVGAAEVEFRHWIGRLAGSPSKSAVAGEVGSQLPVV